MPENVFTFAMNLGQLRADVLRKLWRDFNEDTNGWAPDVAFSGRLTKTRVTLKLNQALMELVTFGQVLKSWFIVPTKQNYREYPVPINVYDIIPPVLFFTSATSYEKLEVRGMENLDEIAGTWMADAATSSPRYAYKGNWSRTNRFLGITPPPSADATAATIDATVLEKPQPYGAVESVYASASPDSTATKMVCSSGQNFSNLGVVPGMIIINITDNSRGTISSISTTNTANDSINVSSLSGGYTNQFNPADECRIIGGSYGGIIEIGDSEASYLIAPIAGSVPQPLITMAAGNMLVRCITYPVLLVDDNQFPELPIHAHQAVASRAAGYLAREFPPDSPEFAQGNVYLEESNQMLGTLRGHMAEHFQLDQPVRIQSAKR